MHETWSSTRCRDVTVLWATNERRQRTPTVCNPIRRLLDVFLFQDRYIYHELLVYLSRITLLATRIKTESPRTTSQLGFTGVGGGFGNYSYVANLINSHAARGIGATLGFTELLITVRKFDVFNSKFRFSYQKDICLFATLFSGTIRTAVWLIPFSSGVREYCSFYAL